jgi:His/Glu/Gln/Arg/opine family amino acid ABC transporter permease subunit
MSIVEIIIEFRDALLGGLRVTLELCLIVWSVGVLVGSTLGVVGARSPLWVGLPCRSASFLLSGIPVLVLLFWMHYPLQAWLGVVIDPFLTATATLSIVNIFAVADLVRGLLRDFPAEYLLAARVCGLPARTILFRIQLPIILRQVLPGLLTLQVNVLHMSLFASLISVPELFRVAQRINATIYRPVEIYTALGIFLLAVCLPLNGLALWLRARYTRDLSER